MLIIFDWDGTLIDSADRIAKCLVLAGQEMEQWDVDEEHAKQVIGLGLPESIAQLYPYLDKEQVVQCCEIYSKLFVEEDKKPCKLFPGVEETLLHLRAEGFFLAIATGKSRKGLNRVLDQLNMHHLFDATRCADETCSKPDPLMLDELMAEFEFEPHQCLMVGDTTYDLLMATQANISSVAVNYGVHDEDTLLVCEPIAMIDELSSLVDVIADLWIVPTDVADEAEEP